MIRLLTTFYDEPNPSRQQEYLQCITRNIDCSQIEELIILCEGGEFLLPSSSKIQIIAWPQRPKYQDYFDLITRVANDSDISIICNTDIFFDDQLELFKHWEMPRDMIFALSRWEFREGQRPELFNYPNSQDAWILQGTPKAINGDFPVGIPRCDNKIAAELQIAGYRVINPSFSLCCYHVHDAPVDFYTDEEYTLNLPPPYLLVFPRNLFGPWATFFYNKRHPKQRLAWRFDKRKYSRLFNIRAVLWRLRTLVSR